MVDITSLLQAPPSDNVLTILLRPAEETQAWQFLSSCIKVTHENSMPSCLCSQFCNLFQNLLRNYSDIYPSCYSIALTHSSMMDYTNINYTLKGQGPRNDLEAF